MPVRTTQLSVNGLSIGEHDATRTYLLLHGGGGRPTMAGFAELLAADTSGRVLLPTHPGFGGTPKPESLVDTRDLAQAYVQLLNELDLSDVTLIGNSFGGWLAAEIAIHGSERVTAAVIVDGVGIEVTDHQMTSVVGLSPAELSHLSFHDPSKAPRPPAGQSGPSPDVQALISYTGPTMSDPSLLDRLSQISLPTRVIWGASDGIVSPDYGRAYAAAIPGATFTLLPESGHLPQVETPEAVLSAILDRP